MNSYENNEEQIKKLERLEKVYNDDCKENKPSSIEEATKEPPLKFLRKIAAWLTILLWAVSIFMLLTGTELTLIMPAMLMSLGFVCAVNIPAFIAKKKFGDVAVCVFAAAVCLIGGVVMLIYSGAGY